MAPAATLRPAGIRLRLLPRVSALKRGSEHARTGVSQWRLYIPICQFQSCIVNVADA